MAQVVLENVYKSYQKGDQSENSAVLRSINLLIEDGEFMVLVGPSGCGKSTLLRLIAGLEELTAGNIRVSDRVVNDLPPKERDIAMVFQNYALYPHMSVYDNLAFGLRRTKLDGQNANWSENIAVGITRNLPSGMRFVSDREKAVQERVKLVARMLQIEPLLNRLPKQLSGGQKQRVALGRAMARNPQVFLMDEPLSNLDAKLRAETRAQIVKLQRQLGTTTIYVTHDQTEAMTMGDRIAVMNAGQIQQLATPLELYTRPANRFVAEFIGSPPMNFLPVQVRAPLTLHHALFQLTLPERWGAALNRYNGEMITLGIRPEHLMFADSTPKSVLVAVDLVEALGHETVLSVRLADNSDTMQVRIEPDRPVKLGEALRLDFPTDKIYLFDSKTGAAISPY
ncbi:ABC transporter ATP-binding protein [Leptolyngbya sp. NIES-2104]|uniref:ABC transporter ATP-binding protein n=1 Tax=Leptolyngbya sp. NIES-2104 TaxID=1552121 RepID=UPI0006ECBC45|nr:ATP-binding cassette domain-containing protein [Leptolyngbya sp. NIES-2104]GAP99035.1 ABC transporter ATP-binding protein [Leptolyngbya sp. NIES-2104]